MTVLGVVFTACLFVVGGGGGAKPAQATPKAAKAASKPRIHKKRVPIQRAPQATTQMLALTPFDDLPTEAVPKPSLYRLRYAGMRDGTAADYVVWTAVIAKNKRTNNLQYKIKNMPEGPPSKRRAVAVRNPAPDPHAIATSTSSSIALVTAVVAKGPQHDERIEALEAAVVAAVAAANTTTGSAWSAHGKLVRAGADLGFDAATDMSWRVNWVNHADWHAIYSTPGQVYRGMTYNLLVPHRVGGKRIRLLLHVPGELPDRTQIDLEVKNLDLRSLLASTTTQYKVKIRVCIKGECKESTLPAGVYKKNLLEVRRRVLAAPSELRVEVSIARRPRKGKKLVEGKRRNCGDAYQRKCRWLNKPGSNKVLWGALNLDAQAAGNAAAVVYDTRPAQPIALAKTFHATKGTKVTIAASYRTSKKSAPSPATTAGAKGLRRKAVRARMR